VACAFLRLHSELGHALTAAGVGGDVRVASALCAPGVDACLVEAEGGVDEALREGRVALAEGEEVYRRMVGLVYNMVDVVGYESGLRGSTEALSDARRQLGDAMGRAEGRQAAALRAAMAYKKAQQQKE
jgi:hypothetical protein